ncbi:WD40 repeat-like protein [Lichtheimia hyalospora FSU 10163]|nr:WD40 repeat-like protein [Lichtheimia hyalospora FSU 10163]
MEIDQDNSPSPLENTNYRTWKKNTPFLYDLLITHGLTWPSLTCQWFPDVERRPDQNYKAQRLLLGTHTNDNEPNYLQIATVQLPIDLDKVDTRKYEEHTNEIGGYGGYNDAHVRIIQKIVHEGEVNRARYQYDNPNIIATKSKSGNVYVFDRTTYESFPKEHEPFHPALRLQSHTKEGYALEWNPHSTRSSHVLSGGFDGLICEWDIGAASKEKRTLQASRKYCGHTAGVEDIAWNWRHDSIFASAGDDRQMMIWDTRDEAGGKAIHNVRAHAAEVNCISFSPGSEWILATGSSDKTVALWDLRNLKAKIHVMEHHKEEVYHLAWSPHHETILATAGSDRQVLVWDVARIGDDKSISGEGPPELLFVHAGHVGGIADFGWNPAEPWSLASADEDNTLHVWQMARTIYGHEQQ